MIDSEELAELKQDRKLEMQQDSYHDRQMGEDKDFAVEQFTDEITELDEELRQICRKLEGYGWTLTPKELLEYV